MLGLFATKGLEDVSIDGASGLGAGGRAAGVAVLHPVRAWWVGFRVVEDEKYRVVSV